MDLLLSENEKMIRDAAHEFLQKECPVEMVREMEQDDKSYPPELWRKMAELGWLGLLFPTEYGGTEGNFVELTLFMEALGKYLVPVPFLPAIILGGLSILLGGTEEQKREFLPRIAQGELICTMAWTELDADYDAAGINTQATRQGDDVLIDGTKLFVPYANIADYLICATRTKNSYDKREGVTLFLLKSGSPGIGRSALKTMACDKQFEVVFNQVRATDRDVIGEYDGGWEIMKKVFESATVAQCALMIGGAERVLEMAVDHAKKRIQFGRPIGSFQAIQHKCANMLIDLEGAKYATYEAAWRISRELPCTLEVSVAKAWVNQAYRRICTDGHQIMGGGGVMKEGDIQLYSRRAKAAEFLWGDTNFHREIVARHLEGVP